MFYAHAGQLIICWRMPSSGMLCHVALHSMRKLLVTANFVPSSPILITLMKEVLHPSKTLVLTRATWCNVPEDGILHSHRRENLKSYTVIYWFICNLCYFREKMQVMDKWYDQLYEKGKRAFFFMIRFWSWVRKVSLLVCLAFLGHTG
jgi:hypothetical protein